MARAAGILFRMNTAFNSTAHRLTVSLRFAAVATLVAVLALWAATGAHRGWTQTSKVVMQHDEITGIDFPVREKTFVAGVEVLAVGVAAAGAFAAASLVAQRRQRAGRA